MQTEGGRLLDQLLRLAAVAEGESMVIINNMYPVSISVAEDYLIQIVHVAITHPSCHNVLRKFLLSLASRSMVTGLRLAWIVDAVAQAFQQCGLGSRVTELNNSLENAAVNMPQKGVPLSADEVQKEIRQKELRCDLFTRQRHFVNQLTTISSYLRTIPDRAKRLPELRSKLAELDESIAGQRLLIPLQRSSDVCKWIVGIHPEECVVFSSRERAPYLLVLETITDPSCIGEDPGLSTVDFNEKRSPEPPQFGKLNPAHRRTHSRMLSADLIADETVGLLAVVFGESSQQKKERIRKNSKYGQHPGWGIESFVIKAGDDLRQEELALQLVDLFNRIWSDAGVTCCVKPYAALSTTYNGGVIQCITDSLSVDSIKKAAQVQSLQAFFLRAYGGEATKSYTEALRNFVESMAGYSVICYILQIKDRHNGNLMLSRAGHIIHIDFGFMLATSPGGINFESAPFKLSQELMDVMGGVNSPMFNYFKVLVFQGFAAARKRADEVLALIYLMSPYKTIPCLGNDPASVTDQIRDRFRLGIETETELALIIRELIDESIDNWRTKRYDQFQTLQNGII